MKRLWKSWLGLSRGGVIPAVAMAILVLTLLACTIGPYFCPQNPYDLSQLSITNSLVPPAEADMDGAFHLLGTDDQGRDVLSSIVYGLRTSMGVALAATVGALLIGVTVGLAAAYFGGAMDSLMMRLVDLQLAFPSILIALVLLSVFGTGADKVVIAIIAVQWATYARTVRSVGVAERKKEYIEAARCLGYSGWRIMFRHLLPNCVTPLSVLIIVQTASAVLLEATLSFLGLGVPVTSPSLGMLISNGYAFMLRGDFWLTVYPGLTLMFVIFSMNAVGNRLREMREPGAS
ncbi:peptide ABC transporter permease [Bordetella genomosp. 9]|uniref:Peptide ABC transporter permease n=1 Tax=Bordetella genomosp. 9 TaxID=1416803 RepID=A0A261R2E7_9BORD|nr:ABC transporter permease [Bordetella genomosp. 9]OZI18790.1 peptide ABC transporter permease [Bordetella genomosp. 9]